MPIDRLKLVVERAQRYNEELNRLEIAPNGDDYNALFDILEGVDVPLPVESGR